MRLLIDIGNTRVKWLLAADGQGPIAWLQPQIGWPDLPSLRAAEQLAWVGVASDDSQRQLRDLWRQALVPEAGTAVLAVGGQDEAIGQGDVGKGDAGVGAAMDAVIHAQVMAGTENRPHAELPRLYRLRSAEQGCGLINGYRNPTQLGADRWAAAMAVWHLRQHSPAVLGTMAQVDVACDGAGAVAHLIVSAGTATTVDHLSPDGRFLGGSITPGFGLMREALAQGTARLPRAHGVWQAFADNTDDAITTGIVHAQLGAVLAGYRWSCDRFGQPPRVWLTGGAAPALLQGLHDAAGNKLGSDFALLAGNILHAPSLVLEGVRAWLLEREGTT